MKQQRNIRARRAVRPPPAQTLDGSADPFALLATPPADLNSSLQAMARFYTGCCPVVVKEASAEEF
jgi:hypothetical protein